MAEKNTDRRGFLNLILGGSALATLGAIIYPIIKYITPPAVAETDVALKKLEFTQADLEAAEQKQKYFKFGRDLGIVFVTDKGEVRACAATCTHLDCTVQNRPDEGILWCACHNGKYSYDGRNISGPPPRPLAPYRVNIIDGEIIVSKEEA
ncbi:MAG TPA: ubiquinol-cytochrome c reductase iron-sulfur subunit [candidate division Zixibacteria bacterium]|nr:ubiquinol-cytochrome c reductase iron-sulfur subunit [candidate division Zixibacteria bacterium]MDD4916596.1 ubiquinol-cytochrome c reductase iron-sulfur subunit [candidate division Zixibacteria bacterium]MDM7973762.1 ubiquinol-cytochrome c reductase iron-sulfur subunit [candidate division Zixibacteria bacterium]HOD65487.1 ubiquinol-cytochrome c reductase iron-sulfur subunit [candidate division Zixibacteria bacterium]HPC11700.1 ubiquinol-cytochrome c reductase iron-sulfur subunit [candidate 